MQKRSFKINERAPRFFTQVYRFVARVPRGKVVTYGQVAALLDVPRASRAVGTALRYLPQSLACAAPWQRVINASGGISMRGDVIRVEEQRWLLENEGVEFNRQEKVSLEKYRWIGPTRKKAPKGQASRRGRENNISERRYIKSTVLFW